MTPTATATAKPTGLTRILGIDIALRTTGYGLLDTDGHSFRVVDCGVIRTSAKERLSECLRRLCGGMGELAETYAPDVAAIESGFFFKNARTAMVLGMARGAAVAVLTQRRVPLFEYAPTRVKQAVCGFGQASKEQVAAIVANLLRIPQENVQDDATDALALAICHAHTAGSAQGLLLPKQL